MQQIKIGDLVKLRHKNQLVGIVTSVKSTIFEDTNNVVSTEYNIIYVMWLNHPDNKFNICPYNISSLKII